MPSTTYGRWNPTDVLERVLDSNWPSPTPFAMNLVTPTSVDKTGTGSTATVNTNGSVTFSSCTTLSLNGVFTSNFDNYMIVSLETGTAGSEAVLYRLRSSFSDASATNYTNQYISAHTTSITGSRTTSENRGIFKNIDAGRDGGVLYIYGPGLTQPTVSRSVNVNTLDSARLVDYVTTHGLSTNYDGITFLPVSATISGLVCVYGLGI